MTTIVLLKGSDPILLGDRAGAAVDELLGDGDRSLALDEFTGIDYDLGAVVDAAQTPPLFGDRRVVVARGASRFSKADDVAVLVQYLSDPLVTSAIVLIWEPVPGQARLAAVPKSLAEAIKGAGGDVISTDPGSSRSARDAWWDEVFADSEVHLDAGARKLLRDHVGEDLADVSALLRLLTAAHGPGASLDAGAVEPYLGSAGSVPPWELTDAIDRGDSASAIATLARMLTAGDRHPLQIMATLSAHYLRIATLDGADVRGEKDAAALLGMRGSTFPAKKALASARALGTSGTHRAIALCAEADVVLRGGGVAWPGELVLEVLVARLCRLGGSTRRSGRGAVNLSSR